MRPLGYQTWRALQEHHSAVVARRRRNLSAGQRGQRRRADAAGRSDGVQLGRVVLLADLAARLEKSRV
jgi:hypothetical protein